MMKKFLLPYYVIILLFGCSSDNSNLSSNNTIPTINITAISDITETTAKCGGNVTNDGGATVTARGICWSTTTNPDINDNKVNNGNGNGTYTSQLTSLIENTSYYVRAYATNSKGTAYSNQLSFTTGESNLPPGDFEVSVQSVTFSSAILSWTRPVDNDGDIVTFTVYLENEIVDEGNQLLLHTLENLNELTTYNGKVVAIDEVGNETTKTFSFTTKEFYLRYLKSYNYADALNGSHGNVQSMIKTPEGNYIIAGTSGTSNSSGFQLFALKIDIEGNELWKYFYNYEIDPSVNFKIRLSNDGGFYMVNRHLVLKIDGQGNEIWYKAIDSFVDNSYNFISTTGEIRSIDEDSQGNLYIVGGRGAFDEPEIREEAILIKLDNIGNVIWEKVFKPSIRNYFDDLVINEYDELIILGLKETSGNTVIDPNSSTSDEEIDFWVIKANSDGIIIWENTFGDGKIDVPRQIIATSDNNFVIVGYGGSIFKLDSNGNEIWGNTTFSNYNPTFSVAETFDNGYVTTGHFDFGNYGAFAITKYDSNGNIEWEKSYQESFAYIFGKAILSTDDGGYLIAAYRWKNYYDNGDSGKIYVYKTDAEGFYE